MINAEGCICQVITVPNRNNDDTTGVMHSCHFLKMWIRETWLALKGKMLISGSLDCWKMVFQQCYWTIACVKGRTYFILKLKDILRYGCIKLFSGLSFVNSGNIHVFFGLSFKNPWEIRGKFREPLPVNPGASPGESGRVDNYVISVLCSISV